MKPGSPLLPGAPTRGPLMSRDTIRRISVFVMFALSTTVLLPVSLRLAVGPSLPMMPVILIAGAVFAVSLYFAGRTMYRENRERRVQRELRDKYEALMDSTYGCVQPQVLGSMVVCPVKVRRRDAESDAILSLDDDQLVVELAQGYKRFQLEGADVDQNKAELLRRREDDTVKRLTRLVADAVNGSKLQGEIDNREFGVRVFSGTSGGPTGLAIAVSRPDYGSTLAAFVGIKLQGATKGHPAPPPGRRTDYGGKEE